MSSNKPHIFAIFIITFCFVEAHQNALCSHVFQMSRYCVPSGNASQIIGRTGKAGPAGPRGPPGRDAVVDYSQVDDKIEEKLQNVLAKVAILEELVTWYRAKNGYIYKVFTDRTDSINAAKNCKKHGAALAAIGVRDPQTHSDLRELARASGFTTIAGLNDTDQEGRFVWSDGEVLMPGQIVWKAGEPNNVQNQDCAGFGHYYDWMFDDFECSSRYNYICEKAAI